MISALVLSLLHSVLIARSSDSSVLRWLHTTELYNAEWSAVRNAGDRAQTRLGDLAGLAGYLKWLVLVGFSRTVNKPVG